REFAQALMDGRLAVTHGGEQIVARGVAHLDEELLELVGTEESRRDQPVLLRLAVEELTTELEGTRALLDLQPLVDLGPRAARLDDLEPVTARMLGGGAGGFPHVPPAPGGGGRPPIPLGFGPPPRGAPPGVE